MVALITCKNEEDPIKTQGDRVLIIIFSIICLLGFFRRSRVANSATFGPIWQNFELVLVTCIMVVLVTCKMKQIRSKMKALEL